MKLTVATTTIIIVVKKWMQSTVPRIRLAWETASEMVPFIQPTPPTIPPPKRVNMAMAVAMAMQTLKVIATAGAAIAAAAAALPIPPARRVITSMRMQ